MASTVWKGHIVFGLVSIPVRLFRAARPDRIAFRRLAQVGAPSRNDGAEPVETEPEDAEPPKMAGRRGKVLPIAEASESHSKRPEEFAVVEPVRQVSFSQSQEQAVPPSQVVKGFEYEKDRYIVVEEADLRGLAAETSRELQVMEFVELAGIDPIYFESSFYVRPDSGGEHPYALFYEALRKTGFVAVGEMAMHRRDHVVVVRPGQKGLILHTVFYNTEIHSADEYTVGEEPVPARELALAEQLIGALSGPFEPEKYHDKYKQRVEEMLARQRKGKALTHTASVSPRVEAPDILRALEQSIAAARKPAQAETRPERRAGTRKSSRARS